MVLSENEEDLGVEGFGIEDDEDVGLQVKEMKIGDRKPVGRLVSIKCSDVWCGRSASSTFSFFATRAMDATP